MKSSSKNIAAHVLIGALLSSQAFAQAPILLPSIQSPPGQQPSSANGLQQQFRPCTPADYGDPMADCSSANTRSPYNPYDNTLGSDPFSGLQNGSLQPGSFPPGSFPPGSQSGMELPPSNQFSEAPKDTRAANPAYYQKEPPTEFQRYVADSIGQMLPIFGASLFERVPATFAPLDRVPVSADYVIEPGDELQVSIWGQFNTLRRLIVSRTGEVVLPEAGPVSVAGMSYSQATSVFKSAYAHLYKNFDLNVTLGRLHPVQVFVLGEARRPGSYTVSSLSTLVNAIFASGGPSSRGSMRGIQLKRGNRIVQEFDLYDLLINGDKSKDALLAPGDVILIPAAGPRVAVAGSIEHRGIYELKAKTTLAEILRLSDGLSPLASRRQILVERVEGGTLRILRIPTTPEGLQTELQNGDIVRVQPIVQRFESTVALRGNVADPGKFPWRDGMRLSDLLPDKEALLTRDYWRDRNSLSSTEDPITDQDTGAAAARSDQNSQAAQPEGTVNGTSEGTLVGTGAIPRSAGAFRPASRGAQLAFREQSRDTQGDTSLGASTGMDSLPPVRHFLPRNTVQPSAPDINWQYAVIERIDKATLSTRVIPFNLGKLVLTHDSSQDLSLEPGDIVTIFSTADFSIPGSQQVKQIRLEGEVNMAGVYTLLPGETLRQLVARAGGLTRNAYLYGAQFTRESTRREQQKRQEDFVNQLEREINEEASSFSSRVTSAQEALTAQTSLASQRNLIDRLRKTPVNGRIVLDMSPQSAGAQALPDLPLENGDRLYIPERPSTVNVVGTVFEQASFLYAEDLRTGDYLKKAGGPTRSADKSHMFVIRADGSVVSRSSGTSVLFAKGFDSLQMYPGDTLIVPTFINRGNFTRAFTDWSQIFSNLALGAAAVNILH
ncbi:MAG TPA: SLBB domain-containing protein [Bryobacteraceae bacterium]